MIGIFDYTPKRIVEPYSWIGHMPFAYWLVRETRPSLLVELGTHTGNSYTTFCQAIADHDLPTIAYAVDTWKGDEQAGFYDDNVYHEFKEYHDSLYASFSTLLRMSFDDAVSRFEDGSIDILHIDGLHTYQSVKHDFDNWKNKMKKDGIIIFHDISVHKDNFGVYVLWSELKQQYNTLEFHYSNGLGILFLDENKFAMIEKKLKVFEDYIVFFEHKARTVCDYVYSKKINISSKSELLNSENIYKNLEKKYQELNKKHIDILNNHSQLEKELKQYQEENKKLSHSIIDERRTISSIIKSRSWRWTRLFRILVNLMINGKIDTKTLNNFSKKSYLRENKDVYENGIDPYDHYIFYGRFEDRNSASNDSLAIQLCEIFNIIKKHKKNGKIFTLIKKTIKSVLNRGFKNTFRGIIKKSEHQKIGQITKEKYRKWVEKFEKFDSEYENKKIQKIKYKPLISIVMPTYKSNKEWLTLSINSVLSQSYSNWELCIADDFSEDKDLINLLEDYAKKDSRIKTIFLQKNEGISSASNSALKLASGEWIGFLDHDDMLSQNALLFVVEAINEFPNVKMIYSDEDKIDENNERVDPYFKPDWNIDLFYSQNMFCHFGIYKHDLIKSIDGFRIGYEGAQDYDLTLRCIEHVDFSSIHHIPKILYHWRIHDLSTSKSTEAKPYANLSAKNALQEHFDRKQVKAQVFVTSSGYRVKYKLPENEPLVSLIIPNKNSFDLLKKCLESILNRTNYSNYEIIIMDNGSDDPKTIEYLNTVDKKDNVNVIKDISPFNYSSLNNKCAEIAKGDILALLNNDVEVISADWLSEMVALSIQPGVGAVGARLWYPNDTLQHGGVILGIGGVAGHSHKHLPRGYTGYMSRADLIQNYSAITGACLVVQKKIYQEVGGLEEKLAVAFNDVDLCLKIKSKGYRNIWTPYAELYHHESASRGAEDTPKKLRRFSKEQEYMKSKWGSVLLNDPAYNCNLTLDEENFDLALVD